MRLVSALLLVLALLFLGRFAILFIAAIIAAILGVFGLGEVEIAQQIKRNVLKAALIGQPFGKRINIAACLFLDPFADHINRRRSSLGNGLAGQLFAQKQRQSALNRDFAFVLRPSDRISAHAHHERGVEIALDAGEIVGAKRLISDLLNRIIASPRNRFWRSAIGVHNLVVMAQFERKTIGKAARFLGLSLGQFAARQWHTKILARGGRRIRAPRDLNLCFIGKRTAGAGQRLLKSVERCLIRHSTIA